MPTPPFPVVYINKAFCELSGLDQLSVIGKPVGSVLQVGQGFPCMLDGTIASSRFLLSISGDLGSKAECQFQVLPITDRSQTIQVMTHLLVKVEPSSDSVSATGGVLTHACSKAFHFQKQIKKRSSGGQEIHATHKVAIG
jgi:hypothetical protein